MALFRVGWVDGWVGGWCRLSAVCRGGRPGPSPADGVGRGVLAGRPGITPPPARVLRRRWGLHAFRGAALRGFAVMAPSAFWFAVVSIEPVSVAPVAVELRRSAPAIPCIAISAPIENNGWGRCHRVGAYQQRLWVQVHRLRRVHRVVRGLAVGVGIARCSGAGAQHCTQRKSTCVGADGCSHGQILRGSPPAPCA